MAVQADGKIVVAGKIATNSNDFMLFRYNSDGKPDTTFGTDGLVTAYVGANTVDEISSIYVLPDGKIIAAGVSGSDTTLARFNADGSLDTTFGTDGFVITDFSANYENISSVKVLPDCRIVVAGYEKTSASSWDSVDFLLACYTPDGVLDTSFGTNGKVLTDFAGKGDYALGLVVQSDGRILLTGQGADGNYNYDFALARFNPDGTPDKTFGALAANSNTVNTLGGTISYTEGGSPVVLDNDIQVSDADLAVLGHYDGASLTLARQGGANAEDQFSGAGIVAGQASGNVTVSGTSIGTYAWSNGTLVINFNGNATQALVNQALQQVAYSNASDSPDSSVQIGWTFSDGNAGSQGGGGALSTTGSVTVNITGTNDAPTATTLTGTNASLFENADTSRRIEVGTITITDDALGNNSVKLSGTDAGSFEVDGDRLYLKAGTALDYEAQTSYAVTVNVQDSGVADSTPVSTDFRLTVTDVDETLPNTAPVITSGTTGSVAENAATSTVIYTATATDPDAGQTLTYSLSGTDVDQLNIDARTGQVTLKVSADYESQSSYRFNVIATDDGTGTLSDTHAVTVSVTNLYEVPTSLTLSASNVAENAAAGTEVGTLSATDEDVGDTFAYALVAGAGSVDADNSLFEIVGNSLRVKVGAVIDFETHPSLAINVMVTDAGGLTYTQALTLSVTDQIEDQDGVANDVEDVAPGLPSSSDTAGTGSGTGTVAVAGDGNGDGIKDSLQSEVTSVPFLNTPQVTLEPTASVVYVSLVADSKDGKIDTTDSNRAALFNVRQEDAPTDLPPDITMPLGMINFSASVELAGIEETFSLYVNASLGINGYWKEDSTGTWVNLASAAYGGAIVQEGNKLRLDFRLVDGGEFDNDGKADGIITDPGALAFMPLSLVGYAPDLPNGVFWF